MGKKRQNIGLSKSHRVATDQTGREGDSETEDLGQ